MLKALRGEKAAVFWTILRIYVGIQWIEAGWHKITGAEPFSAKVFLIGAIKKAAGDHPSVQTWYASFLEGFAVPNVGLFDFIIPWGELLVGLGLILGTFTTIALLAGAFMNLNFMLAGSTSTNPMLYTLAIILLFVGQAAYRWGVDYYLLPYLIQDKELNNLAS